MVALHIESIISRVTAVEDRGLEVVEVDIVDIIISLHGCGTGERPCSRHRSEGKKQCEKVGKLHLDGSLAEVVRG